MVVGGLFPFCFERTEEKGKTEEGGKKQKRTHLHSCLHTSRFFSNGVSGTVPLASSAASPRLQVTNAARSLVSSSAEDISGDHFGRRGSFSVSAAAASAASRSSGDKVGPPAPAPPFSTSVGPMMTASQAFSAEKSRLASEA